jgi:AcrR family transcriptional regulator
VDQPREGERLGGLDRARLVAASLELVQAEGLDGLSMRGLADRLGVKAASLYWHVRDRRELLDLLATALLDEVPVPGPGGQWRAEARELCAAFGRVLASHRDSARILLEVPSVLEASPPADHLRGLLVGAGLPSGEAADATSMLLFHVVIERLGSTSEGHAARPEPGRPARVTIANGSRGVTLRAGTAMDALARAAKESVAAAGVTVVGSEVVVRRLRGTGQAEVELNPGPAWSIEIQGGTWNSRLLLSGLDLERISFDGGATRVDAVLPVPRGIVPIDVSGGALAVRLHRPPGTAAIANVSAGAVQVKLDALSTALAVLDAHWESPGARQVANRYELRVSGGAIQVSFDDHAPSEPGHDFKAPTPASSAPGSAVDLLLDGIERRAAR